jgi:hypothetical protein
MKATLFFAFISDVISLFSMFEVVCKVITSLFNCSSEDGARHTKVHAKP